jgi:hypothetical protein
LLNLFLKLQFKRLPDYVLDTHPYHVSITYAWVIQHQDFTVCGIY